MGVVGLGILIFGLWGVVGGEGAKVEIIKGGSQPARSYLVGSEKDLQPSRSDLLITVDVAGEVEKPGVYKLPSGSRIGDALVIAGGLGVKADREWVSKTINLAEVMKDGGKVYIPNINIKNNPAISGRENPAPTKNAKININLASESELDSLVGIGAVRAQTIIASRPYGNLEELVSKAKIPQSVYDKIKDSISIY